MQFDDKRRDHLAKINLENSRVNVRDAPIIFLCGGKVDVKSPYPLSLRQALIEHLHKVGCTSADQITLAEEFEDWLYDGLYPDLLIFEEDIANIASILVIVLESAGSLAELGLFVNNSRISEKVIVFVKDEFHRGESFISLGPLRYLENKNITSVCAYSWDDESLSESVRDDLPHMRDDILNTVQSLDRTVTFDIENTGHQSFLVYELIRTFHALTVSEIREFLGLSGVSVSLDELKRYIFILTKFRLIDHKQKGHTKFYHAVSSLEKLQLAGKFKFDDAHLDSIQFYSTSDMEKKRFSVIKSIRKHGSEAA